MSRNNLINGLTGMYITGNNKWVYKIKSPNGRHHMLVNRISLAKFLNRNNYAEVNKLVAKQFPHVVRGKKYMRNYTHPSANLLSQMSPNNWNNLVPTRNYVFRKWNNYKGMVFPRTQFGPIKLTNINHHQLSNNNFRNLRVLRRQNTKNAEESARKTAVKRAANNAERKKYIYGLKYPDFSDQRKMRKQFVDASLSVINFPKNAEPVTGPHNFTNIKRRVHGYFSHFPNYNMSRISIYPYKLKN